ncbi:hypothetical protein UFOVP29_294 [uncultured Caudovirales phage]|uniref:Uncharacterized protein n=1 Tax=uncultured Caudovirales phage TaxID=2100421 RepID=A0A6J5KP55_9CAUD|nr:hypothetical protein UFOVP29_294 [uncultured Caudovirales phage]
MADQRKTINLLPAANQTATLSKFFNATVDHLFQPENTEFLAGYIGSHPAWYNADTDFYIQEPTADRESYQLVPTAISRDPNSGYVSQILFYDDLLNNLRLQGANVSKPERLFNSEYYSWSPPVDLDMLTNWTNYYWVPAGPNRIDLLDATDFVRDIQGKTSYTYTGHFSIANASGIAGASVTGTITFTTGLKIRFANDSHPEYTGVDWLVCNVGRAISLQDDSWASDPASALRTAVSTGPDWWTMERGCDTVNSWSLTNRWFHIDVLNTVSGTNIVTEVVDPLTQTYGIQATRPVLQYFRNLELYDQGNTWRGYINYTSTEPNFLAAFVGQSAPKIDNTPLVDGDLILCVSDVDANVRGRIYKVSGLASINQCVLTAQPRSLHDASTDARAEDQALLIHKSGTIDTWYFVNDGWTQSQTVRGQTNPLFELYDVDGNLLSDPGVYPNSDFSGSSLFDYQTSSTSTFDALLGISGQLNAFGDWIFLNSQQTDSWKYISDNQVIDIVGYRFAHILAGSVTPAEYINGWFKSTTSSRQYYNYQYQVINGALINTGELNRRELALPDEVSTGNLFKLETYVSPQATDPNTLPNLFVSLARNGQTTTLIAGQDYTVGNGEINLTSAAQANDRYFVKIWLGNQYVSDPDGYYDLPWNLTNNPNNQDITNTTRGEYLDHVSSIIANQTGVVGNPQGVNNWRDTARNPSLGMFIMQHTASMLKLSVLNSTPQNDINAVNGYTNPQVVMNWAEAQYVSWYTRFINSLFNLYNTQGYTLAQDPQTWITTALRTVNLGKTSRSAWANSGYDASLYAGSYCEIPAQNPTWIPATATRLGITGAYHPEVFVDVTQPNNPLVILTHDGAQIVMTDSQGERLGDITNGTMRTRNPALLSNPVVAAWLQFELSQYNNLPDRYRDPDQQVRFNIRSAIPGKWRTNEYTRDEYIQIQRGSFDKWLIGTQADATANVGFSINDQFSFNYRSVNDLNGQPIPGYWRGIYQWFYDTDRPDLRPWEMLGFTQQPTWWTAEYGAAPYTRGNTKMWLDLSQGLIRQGALAGTHSEWSRPGLMSCIPVDSQGYLVPPLAAGVVTSLPSTASASGDWTFGDGAPVEQAWRKSQSGSFAMAWCGYLLKPAQFVELNWDTLRTKEIYADTTWSQWIYTDVGARKSSAEFLAHRENPSQLTLPASLSAYASATYYGSGGLQHWFSEYLVNANQNVTTFLGNVLRGADVNLGHKFAGYVKSDNMRVLVDSFGQLDYQSRIVPQENQNVYLYRSGSIGEYFYSGVVVQKVSKGYKVFGYDAILPQFSIIPNNTAARKNYETLGNLKVTFYQEGLRTTEIVPYGTVFATPQQVVDFLTAWGRWLESQGWTFETTNSDNSQIVNWQYSAREFIFWCQGSWGVDNFIALSPSSDGVTFTQDTGQIQYVNGKQSGVYPIVNKTGTPIISQNLETLREDNQITIRPTNNQTVYGARLFVTTLEHILILDNVTQFNDIVYQPLYAQMQPRVKIFTYRTLDWNGRLTAPGFFLQRQANNTYVMTDNFEKTANDMRKYFNIDQPKHYHQIINNSALLLQQTQATAVDQPNTMTTTQMVNDQSTVSNQAISNLARHNYGYQKRDYLQNLILEDATEFEFYQGYIRQKGSFNSINAILRNGSLVPVDSNFEYFEEFALRLGQYGGTAVNNQIEFQLTSSDIVSNPQRINLFSAADYDNPDDDVVNLVPGDSRIVTAPESYQTMAFSLRHTRDPDPMTDVPTAGYVQLAETTWQIATQTDLLTLWDSAQGTTSPVNRGDTVWQFYTDIGSWTAWVLLDTGVAVSNTKSSTSSSSPTTIVGNSMLDLVDGDIVVIQNVTGVTSLTGTYVVSNVDVINNSFTVPVSTFENGTGGTIWKYYTTRFATVTQRNNNTPSVGWPQGIHVYVDQGDQIQDAWTVYSRLGLSWTPIRNQPLQVNGALMQGTVLYDSTYQTASTVMQYFDPVQGYIPSIADADLIYKRETDPARYNNGSQELIADQAWGDSHVGETWWNLSAARYVDYHQGDLQYRAKNWGKLATGTTVDIYEWVKSPISPTMWAEYVSTGQNLSQFGVSYVPQGVVLNANNPSWTQVTYYKVDGSPQTWYYFWVKNSAMMPPAPWRTLTTQEISTVITNPPSQAIPWWAAIDQTNILVANIANKLSGSQKILQINWQDHASDATRHSQWHLFRPGDVRSVIDPQFWQRLTASLVGWDGMDRDVPDYKLHDQAKLGNLIRPRQSWFRDAVTAGQVFVYVVNKIIAAFADPLTADTNKATWINYFSKTEPQPASAGNWQHHVANLSERDALLPQPVGTTVLVDATMQTQNKWMIYQYAGGTTWDLVRQQAWNTTLYWQYVDWYAAGYTTATLINQTVAVNNDLLLLAPATGQVVKVLDNGNSQWQWFTWTGTEWQLAAQQSASIALLPALYDNSINLLNWDQAPFDTVLFDNNASVPFYNIIQGLRNVVLDTLDLNNLMISMINYVFSEQGFVDWVTKTSFITIRGFNLPLSQSQLYAADNIESLLQYIGEIKPYRAKIREFISSRTSSDLANMRPTDFDKPPLAQTDGSTRILDVNSDSDVAYMKTSTSYQDWYQDHLHNTHLVRRINVSIYFDRVSSDAFGWDYVWEDPTGYSKTSSLETWGSATRIRDDYAPGPGLPAVSEIASLLQAEYKGTVIGTAPMPWQAGWNGTTWNYMDGWDSNEDPLYDYLDSIIQGGEIPEYDVFTPTGVGSQNFNLSYIPQSPGQTVVWVNSRLAVYGMDFIIPNWIVDAKIVDPGTGFQVGDTIQIAGGDNFIPAVMRVMSITLAGGIKTLAVTEPGSWDVVPSTPVVADPVPYSGSVGMGATVLPQWGGDHLLLNTVTTNKVYVLYHGMTFHAAPQGTYDSVYDGYRFIQPDVNANRPPELAVLRVPNSIRWDVTNQAQAGIAVSNQIHTTDGTSDRYSLGATPPQNNHAVIAWLDGVRLNTTAVDFFVNYNTNELVFVTPPLAGQQLITWTLGGGAAIDNLVDMSAQNQHLQHLYTQANGVSATYILNDLVGGAQYLRITVDGVLVPLGSISTSGHNVTISPVPYSGSEVIIDHFATTMWSKVVTQTIATVSSTDYTLTDAPEHGTPEASMQVLNVSTNRLLPALQSDWSVSASTLTIQTGSRISDGDTLQILTMPEDLPWNWQLEQFDTLQTTYTLAANTTVIDSIQVYVDGVPQAQGTQYSVSVAGDVVTFGSAPISGPVAVYYALGIVESSAVTKRVLVSDTAQWSQTLSNPTSILQAVHVDSAYLDVADYTVLTMPTRSDPGFVWIDNELIAWWNIQYIPDVTHPHRAILSNLWRNYRVTSGNPLQSQTISHLINSVVYDGQSTMETL